MRTRKLRVLHCPTNIANSHWFIARAERELGLISDVVCFQKPRPGIFYDRCLDIKDSLVLPYEFKRFVFFKEAVKKYDVFHFSYGLSILDHAYPCLSYWDLPLLKKFSKKIVMTYHGDDARQKDFYLENYGVGHYGNNQYTLADRLSDQLKRSRIRKISQYADAIFAFNPDLLRVLPEKTRFLAYPSSEISKPTTNPQNNKLKIIHAPSDRQVKGTDLILKTINRISRDYQVEAVLVENKSYQEAQAIYQQADICIDQLKVGFYGGFAVEAMALGKPVVAYLRMDDIKRFVPFWREIPIINADESTLERTLIDLIKNEQKRQKIGMSGYKFVRKNHNSIKIAKDLVKAYESFYD